MPHQCVRCNTFYDDGANELLTGCSCGAKLFFYVKKDNIETVKKTTEKLTKKEIKRIENDVKELIGTDDIDQPVVLDFESIRIPKPGQYHLDLVHLFKGEPLVYRLEDGKYIIDIPSSFQLAKNKKKEDEE
ncbi:Zn-ribbon domain-containing protein [Candidatus Woesearchaeota archaeon]|nr:Zn-ribbon domain-containing protein [Candidatus Woesearchaeota archaeon]MBW3014659.1 Zn-ribbon domain-containing protein [Candidatus Woesearchaeota archaeon]